MILNIRVTLKKIYLCEREKKERKVYLELVNISFMFNLDILQLV